MECDSVDMVLYYVYQLFWQFPQLLVAEVDTVLYNAQRSGARVFVDFGRLEARIRLRALQLIARLLEDLVIGDGLVALPFLPFPNLVHRRYRLIGHA